MRPAVFPIEPCRMLDLDPVSLDLTASIFAPEANHQGVGKRPGLAGKVVDILDLDTNLVRQ